MMIATLRWRDEFKVEDAMKETYPDELNVFGHVYGHDKEGRPVVCVAFSLTFFIFDLTVLACRYNIYGGGNDIVAAFSDVQRFIRYVSESPVYPMRLLTCVDGAWR